MASLALRLALCRNSGFCPSLCIRAFAPHRTTRKEENAYFLEPLSLRSTFAGLQLVPDAKVASALQRKVNGMNVSVSAVAALIALAFAAIPLQ